MAKLTGLGMLLKSAGIDPDKMFAEVEQLKSSVLGTLDVIKSGLKKIEADVQRLEKKFDESEERRVIVWRKMQEAGVPLPPLDTHTQPQSNQPTHDGPQVPPPPQQRGPQPPSNV